jgi:hypothetical protein
MMGQYMMRKMLAAAAALVITMGAASAANAAYVFNTEGQSQTIYFNGFNSAAGGALDADLQAKLTLTLFDIDANGDFTFNYSFENLSTGNDAGASRLVNFGFNVDADLQSASIVNGFFSKAKSGNVVAGQPDVDFCATNGNGCTAGGNASKTLENGEVGAGKFLLNFASPQSSASLDNLQVRWISLNNGGSGYGLPTTPGGPGAVPEPATWMMMIMGFGGLGAMIRRRRVGATAAA